MRRCGYSSLGTRYLNAKTRRGERKGNRLLLEPGLGGRTRERERERERDDDADGGGKSVGSVISGDPQVAFDKSPMKAILLAEPLGNWDQTVLESFSTRGQTFRTNMGAMEGDHHRW